MGMAQPPPRLRRGDYSELLACLTPMLRMARGLTGNLDDAEDLVHDVIASVLPKWGHLTSDPAPYLLRAIHNRAISRHRTAAAASKATERLRRLQPRDDNKPLETSVIDRDLVFAALEVLDQHHRAAVVLRYGLDMDTRSTADVLGHPEGTIRRWCHEALADLRTNANLGELS